MARLLFVIGMEAAETSLLSQGSVTGSGYPQPSHLYLSFYQLQSESRPCLYSLPAQIPIQKKEEEDECE